MIREFDERFGKVLKNSVRWEPFRLIANDLLTRKTAVNIVETGCARQAENWSGDGQSTQLWNWIIEKTGGSIVSFDINKNAVEYARTVAPLADVRCVDSVQGLRQLQHPEHVDLLYLDSFDLTGGIESPTHHLAELSSIYPRLSPRCLIAVDDCESEQHGKHRFVRDYLQKIGVLPVYRGYITIWVKP